MTNNTNSTKRTIANLNQFGITSLHHRNPYIIAWWSMAFPGFGHLLLNKALRGYVLIIWEVIINHQTKLNLAMVYSFMGDIQLAKEVLNPRWMLLYIPLYMYAIYDSYRTTIDVNRVTTLAKRENQPISNLVLGPFEVNYLDKKSPFASVIWSMFMPGAGQLYLHRIVTAFYLILWLVIISYYSRFVEGIFYIIIGEVSYATTIFDKQWLLYLPSLYGFAIYHAYVNCVEVNKLFTSYQKQYLQEHFQENEPMLRNQI